MTVERCDPGLASVIASVQSAWASAVPFGDPSPVAMSYPEPAGYSPKAPVMSLLPEVTSLKSLLYAAAAAWYRAGLANPIGVPAQVAEALVSAISAAHAGAAALVPPTTCHPGVAGGTAVPDPFQ